MLPKPEKVKKIKHEQLNLVDEISEKKKRQIKQLWLIISICLTIGLSLIFNLYRHLSSLQLNFNFDLPKISAPSSNIDLENANISYSIPATTDSMYSLITGSDFSSQKEIAAVLPQGIKFKQYYEEQADYINLGYEIITPAKSLIILLKLNGPNPKEHMKDVPKVVEKLYWSLI